MVWETYTWLFVVSILLALFVAWGIGANDVSNSFGTSVGAKALTLKQAILVASFCEFGKESFTNRILSLDAGGAVLLGSGVTDTIKSGIANVNYYTYKPELLMYGMVCALFATGLWLLLATFLELPVSTTHSIVGAIIGMSMVAAGPDSIIWTAPANTCNVFPGGVVAIVLAWFITPAMAAVVAGLLFAFTKLFVLRAKNPFRRSLILFPLYTFITVWVITYFVIQKGVNGWMKSKTYSTSCTGVPCVPPTPTCPAGASTTAACGSVYKKPKVTISNNTTTWSITNCQIPDSTNAWISAVTAAVCSLIAIAGLKLIVKWVEADVRAAEEDEAACDARRAAKAAGIAEGGGEAAAKAGAEIAPSVADTEEELTATVNRTPAALQSLRRSKIWTTLAHGSNYDIHESVEDDAKIMAMHDSAEVFDRKSEYSFKYLQVLTACANSFAHGANDVANAIGSMAAVYSIWECACVNSKSTVPVWMFVIGGVGLIIGLATYGYKIIRAFGVKMTKLTNSRGYCAELTSSIIVIVASRYGFPVSTTQVITGAITGIGMEEVISAKVRGEKAASNRFNFKLLLKFFGGWVATLIVAGLTSAAFMAQGIYSPSRPETDLRATQNAAYNSSTVAMAQDLIKAGNVTNPTPAQEAAVLQGVKIINATRATWNSNGPDMLNTAYFMDLFQNGTWATGNATLAGVFNGTNAGQPAFMPYIPAVNAIDYQ